MIITWLASWQLAGFVVLPEHWWAWLWGSLVQTSGVSPHQRWPSWSSVQVLEIGRWPFLLLWLSSLRDTGITFLKKVICLWPCWVFIAVSGVSLLGASKGHSPLPRVGFPWQGLPLLLPTGCRARRHNSCGNGLSCPMACRIFPDQGSNLPLLHWQTDSFKKWTYF